MPDSESFDQLKARGQHALIDFLRIDLDLAFTFLKTAQIESGSDADHCRAALEKARTALKSIRRFLERVEDPGEREKVNRRANKLEAALNAFRGSN